MTRIERARDLGFLVGARDRGIGIFHISPPPGWFDRREEAAYREGYLDAQVPTPPPAGRH